MSLKGQHSGTAPLSDPELKLQCVSFLWFPPKHMQTDYSKLKVYVCIVHLVCIPVSSSTFQGQVHCDPDQDKAITDHE